MTTPKTDTTDAPEMGRFVCPPDHRHGDNATCWGRHRCRCGQCREAHRVRCALRRKQIAYGRHEGTVDAEAIRLHVNSLRSRGWTVRAISEASGVHIAAVNRVSLGWGERIRFASARALMNVHHWDQEPPALPRSLVDGTGTRRRLQALMFMGYSGPN